MAESTVLVVEDEPEFLHAYCQAITQDGGYPLVGAVTTLALALAPIDPTA